MQTRMVREVRQEDMAEDSRCSTQEFLTLFKPQTWVNEFYKRRINFYLLLTFTFTYPLHATWNIRPPGPQCFHVSWIQCVAAMVVT